MNFPLEYITPTLVNLYHICQRQLWLHVRGLRMEHNSDAVYEGKWLHRSSYPQRAARFQEINLGHAKIDYYDPHTRTVHETKRSDKMEPAHLMQVKYYVFLLEKAGLTEVKGLLEYPKLKKKVPVNLSDEDRSYLNQLPHTIRHLIAQKDIPPLRLKSQCRVCSYFDFCWSE